MSGRSAAVDLGALNSVAESFAATHRCPTISWGLVLDGALAASGAVGNVTDRTVFRIASMTKSFSAAATLILRDDGVLRLDDAIADHAPELEAMRRADIDAAPITIRDLLSMTSGLPTDDPWADRHLDLTDDEFDRIIADQPLFAFPTGDTFEYSNFGFAVLGRVLHRVTGRRLQEIVSERLLEPLGMAATSWVQPTHDDWARPMRLVDGVPAAELPPLGDGLIAPMGGLWTNVTDLTTWVAWLDDAFPARSDPDDGPLCRASRREMQRPQRYAGVRTLREVPAASTYGFGVGTLDEPAYGIVRTHSGGLPGYGSNMRWLPGRRVGVIALANITYAPMAELTALLMDAATEQGAIGPALRDVSEPLRSAAERLVALLNDWDDDTAERLCTKSLSADDPLDDRRAAAAELIARAGRLTLVDIEPLTAARATVRCRGEADLDVAVTYLLAPPRPPRIQSYTITSTVSSAGSG